MLFSRPLAAVVLQQRLGLLAVGDQALADHLGLVVGPAAAGQPLEQLLLRHLQFQHHVQRRSLCGQHGVQGLGLGDGPRKAVQQVAAAAIRLPEPLGG